MRAGHGEGAGWTHTQHSHREVLARLRLRVLSHTRVSARLGRLQATQLEAAPTGDHAVRHAALCGTDGQAGLSPARTRHPRCCPWAQTPMSCGFLSRCPSPTQSWEDPRNLAPQGNGGPGRGRASSHPPHDCPQPGPGSVPDSPSRLPPTGTLLPEGPRFLSVWDLVLFLSF